METLRCKQCGEVKPIEQFRPYYGGRTGYYRTCKVCEKINARAKYLVSKGDNIADAERQELDKIAELYDLQRAAGLQPPRTQLSTKQELASIIDSHLEHFKAYVKQQEEYVRAEGIPQDLQKWLVEPLTEVPEVYQDEILSSLLDKYRQVIRIDQTTFKPVFDQTYDTVLNKIMTRFDNYEDDYYGKGSK